MCDVIENMDILCFYYHGNREYIEWFQNGDSNSLEERLSHDANFRQFVL